MNILLDKESPKTFSQQIARQLIGLIEKGDIKEGASLPAERKLAETLQISRGTVRSAYNLLNENGYTYSIRGGGHVVINATDDNSVMITKANEIIDELLCKLTNLNISTYEISRLFNMKLLAQEKKANTIRIALIECRKDILYLFEKQLERFENIDLTFLQVDELLQSPQLSALAKEHDILLTTATHFFDVCYQYPQLKDSIVEIVVTWSKKTVFDFATIKENARIGVLYSSPRTVHLIESALKYFDISFASFTAFNENNIRSLNYFVKEQDVIIAEPLSCIFENNTNNDIGNLFKEKGGKIIKFEHIIDEGSLKIIEQAITNFLGNL